MRRQELMHGFPLPVILWDDGIKVFSAGKFHHGEEIAEVDGQLLSSVSHENI